MKSSYTKPEVSIVYLENSTSIAICDFYWNNDTSTSQAGCVSMPNGGEPYTEVCTWDPATS